MPRPPRRSPGAGSPPPSVWVHLHKRRCSSTSASLRSAGMALSYADTTRALAYLTERGEDALHAVKELIGSTGAGKYLDSDDTNLEGLRAQLESSQDVERLEGLRRVVAMISKGRDAGPYLASVFKLTSTSSLEIRKLVYIVVLRYAPSHPDLALLSINSFQRDLSDPSPLIRGMALRALSGIRLRTVAAIVLMAVARAARDSHPYVRKIAALALPKCYRLDPSQHASLLEHLKTLLRDRSPTVLGAAVTAYLELCPTDWGLLHRYFRKLAHALVDMDEWSQASCTDMLVRYARANLRQPAPGAPLDEDLVFLLDAVAPLLASMNPAVVMAAVRAHAFLAPSTRLSAAVAPLVRLLRSPPETAYVAATYALAFAREHADLLSPHAPAFYVRAADPEYLARTKIRVLVRTVRPAGAASLAAELAVYARGTSDAVATDSVTAIGELAGAHPAANARCLELLVSVAQDASANAAAANRAVQVAKTLLQAADSTAKPADAARLITRFALRLFVPIASAAAEPTSATTTPRIFLTPAARSDVLWLLGQYCALRLPLPKEGAEPTLAELLVPDVLRCLVAHWRQEHATVRCQALTLAAKVYVALHSMGAAAHVLDMVTVLLLEMLALGLQDSHADTRDRARFYSGLTRRLGTPAGTAMPEPTDDEENRAYIAAHEKLDDLRLPGVRLRFDQVQHVLFAQGDTGPPRPPQLDAPIGERNVPVALGGFAPVAGGIHLRSWALAQVGPWADPATLPPPIVRTPDAETLKTSPVTSQSAGSPWLGEQRSFQSGEPSQRAQPPKAERVLLTPSESPPPVSQPRSQYEDLDAFLNQSDDEDERSVDADAPEDDEYRAGSD